MPTTPPSITALPAPPDPNDRATYNARAYPWSVAQQTLATEVAAVADNVFDNATEAAAAAAIAVPAAAAAEAASNAALWVSGTTYAAGDVVWSPINALSYRRKTAGAGTTDPSADSANWASLAGGVPSLLRSARTSNTMLAAADKGKLIDITSGTFTQTFQAAATLADGWWCYIRNAGTGDITLDPNASETIDGLASFVMYPGEVRLIQCDGTNLRSVVLTAFSKTFTASGTFTKPPGYSVFEGLMWGGGASGAKATSAGGGGGGACLPLLYGAAVVTAAVSVTVGAGGLAVSFANTDGNDGGNTQFLAAIAYGGRGGGGGSQRGGIGGGWRPNPASKSEPDDYSPVFTSGTYPAARGGQCGSGYAISAAASASKSAEYGGGGGGQVASINLNAGASVFGGGGGGAATSGTGKFAGASFFGGAGGDGSTTTPGVDGFAPGGGGGATDTGATSGAGARGELRIWGVL